MTFTIGQRWVSNSESQLGLGIITAINGRHVCINFPAAEEERVYAAENAPLSRIIYSEGEKINALDQKKLEVINIAENKGLIVYTGIDEAGIVYRFDELALDCFIKLTTPQQRLFSDQIDKLHAFKLRTATLNHISRLQQSKVRGLLGSRTSHLPHQVYIANEIAQRYAPRVLLADEVGLGKTIEAGMIIHYQLHTGRATRVLIVVPNTLIHQWLVEMRRRFNLYFSIFDEERYEAMTTIPSDETETEDKQDNPFESEQLILCSLDFLVNNAAARQTAIDAKWDLLVVDEAHHLQSESEKYHCIEQLSLQSKGLLLLTATPEQVGVESHFSRLQLLDPDRFHNFAAFKQEEERYQELNTLVRDLLSWQKDTPATELSNELQARLNKFLDGDDYSDIPDIINNLLDRHGTGRVLFRNTRAAIKGFPERRLHPYPLACPAAYDELANTLYPENQLDPEQWLQHDPRIQWLSTIVTDLFPAKILIICVKAETALALEQYLKQTTRCTSFHEGLSIIERDRAAAYFAEEENGAQVMVCSEIGSEGRNFQFTHHLVLFDLPLNPDLLEQRIGRLDRIGQRHTIETHVPYLLNTAQEKLFRWYHEGINLFEKSAAAGAAIFQVFEHQLLSLLETKDNNEQFARLISDTKSYTSSINMALSEGRDRLLEMNSCNLPEAEELIAAIESEENSLELESYMADIFHEYGVEHEYHSDNAEILRPSEHMKTGHFPGLKEDGVTITYSRTKALIREDMEFLSWEHPIVCEAMEMILNSEVGNATIATLSVKGLPPGTLFLETFYTLNCAAPRHLQLERFLPLTPIRLVVDISGKNLSNVLAHKQLNSVCEKIKRHLSHAIIKEVRRDIEQMLGFSNTIAEEKMHENLALANSHMKESIGYEINRLEALQKINPSIRHDEIEFFKNQLNDSEHYINQAALKLEALRVIISK